MKRCLLLVGLCACTSASGQSDWMAKLPDASSLAALSIPGTHDSGAIYEPYAGIAKTQALTIAEQLDSGIRYFDIRCGDVDDQFYIYHGSIDEKQSFDQVLSAMTSFLEGHPGETVIASVKQEQPSAGATKPFDQAFEDYVAQSPTRWYVQPTVPVLGAVRGKLVLLRRFDSTSTSLGIDATNWADNATFTISDADATMNIEDDYIVNSNDAKWTAIDAALGAAATDSTGALFLTYTSGYQTVSALPDIPVVADDIDARLDAWLADPANAHAHTGVVAVDFATEARAAAIIATN